MALQALTANRLRDGRVVYLDRSGRWSERIADARTADSDAAAATLVEAGEAAVAARAVVGPYLITVIETDGEGPRPVGQRETIRAAGPSVESDFRAPASRERV